MPLARYFVFVGSVLVVLLFGANWMWPSSAPVQPQDTAAQAPLDAPIARIHSTQKWPDKIQFDTSMPTIVPPAPPVVAATAPPAPPPAVKTADASPLDARAEIKRNVQPAPAARRQQAKVHRRYYARQTTSRWANAYPSRWANASPMASPWSWNW